MNAHGVFTYQGAQVLKEAPGGSPVRGRIMNTAVLASPVAGNFMDFEHRIEGIDIADLNFGKASAKSIAVRIYVNFPAGTYGFSLSNSGGSRSYVKMFTVTAAEAGTDKLLQFVIPGDTSGTWIRDVSGTGLLVRICMMCGSTYKTATEDAWLAGNFLCTNAQTNGCAVNNQSFEFADIGVYEGTEFPDWENNDYEADLLKCQRYFRFLAEAKFATGHGSYGGAIAQWDITLMRNTPAVSASVQQPFGGFPTSFNNDIMTLFLRKVFRIWCSTTAPSDSGGIFFATLDSRL